MSPEEISDWAEFILLPTDLEDPDNPTVAEIERGAKFGGYLEMEYTKESPMCVCGHRADRHWSETVDEYFSGIFNPDLAGLVTTHTYMYCDADLDRDPQGEPCSSMEHGWGHGE